MAQHNVCFPEEKPAAKLIKPDHNPNNMKKYFNLGCQFRGKSKSNQVSEFAHKETSTNKPTTNASSSLLDKSSTSIDCLCEFEIPMDKQHDCSNSGQEDSQSCASSTSFTKLSECGPCEASFVNDSAGRDRKEPSKSTSEKNDSGLSSSYDFGDDLDEKFIEELCKCRENSSDGWTSYYKLLNNLVENSLRENSTTSNCENQFSYVHSKGKKRQDFSGLDDFGEVHAGYEAVVNRNTTSEQITFEDKPNISSGVQSVDPTDGNTRTRTNAAKEPVKEKETSSSATSAPRTQSPNLSKSEKEFYRNLRYYFGGGKIKSRKLSTDCSGNDCIGPHEKATNGEPKILPRSDLCYSDVRLKSNSKTSYNDKQFSSDSNQRVHEFAKGSDHVLNDKLKESNISSDQTENVEDLQKRKEKHSDTKSKGGRTSFSQDKTTSASDPQLTNFFSRSKKKQCTNPDQNRVTSHTHSSGFMSRKPKETGHSGAETLGNKNRRHSVESHLQRGKGREKGECLDSDGNVDCSVGRKRQGREMPFFNFIGLRPSFSLLRKTGKTYAKRCFKYCGVIVAWLLTLAALIISTVFFGAMHASLLAYNRCIKCVANLTYLSDMKRKFYVWYQGIKSWLKQSRRSMARNQSFNLPKSGSDAIHQLLANKDNDPYSILGVTEDVADEDIKRQYRKLAVLVHPDKNSHSDAAEAFKILSNAFETLGTPEKRVSYDREMEQKKEDDDWMTSCGHPDNCFNEYRQKMREMKNHIYCESCDGKHRRHATHRPIYAARYCAQCNTRHAAKEGDVWLESSLMGFKVHVYACMEHEVYEVTEWARCQKINSMDRIPADAHSVSLKIRTHSSRPSQSSRKSYPFRSEEDILEDFLRDMFRPEFGDYPFNDLPRHSKAKKKMGKRKKRR